MTLASSRFVIFQPLIHPSRKYRIEIHSESIWTIPIYSDICIQANANHSQLIRETFCILFDDKRSKINPINSETPIRMNPNQFGTKFWIQINPINPSSDWSKPNFQSGSIRIIPTLDWLDWYGLKTWFRIDSDSFGLSRIDFLPFFIKRVIKRFSDWFGKIRIGLDTDIGMDLIDSEWIWVRYFLQWCII